MIRPVRLQLSRRKSSGQAIVDHPPYYGGSENPYEAIKVIRAWGLGFCLGNALKYIARAGKKDPAKMIEDLKKARWYLDDEIACLESHLRCGIDAPPDGGA